MASSGSEWPRVGYDCWNTFDYVYHITCIISILLANAYTDICLLCFVTKNICLKGQMNEHVPDNVAMICEEAM